MPLLCKSAPTRRVTQWHFVIVYFVFCILYWCISVFCILINAAMPLLWKTAPTRRVRQWHFVLCDCVFSFYWCILYFVFCEMHIEVLCKSAATGGVTKTSCTSIIVHVSYLHEQWTMNKRKYSTIRTSNSLWKDITWIELPPCLFQQKICTTHVQVKGTAVKGRMHFEKAVGSSQAGYVLT